VAGGVLAVMASQGRGRVNRDLQAAGLIGLGVGVATMVFAETAIDPSADVRAWTTIPDQIYLGVARAPPGETELTLNASGPYGGDQSQRWTGVRIEEGRTTLLWFRLLPSRKGGVYPREGRSAPDGGSQNHEKES